MRIEDVRADAEGGIARVRARAVFETVDRDPVDLSIEWVASESRPAVAAVEPFVATAAIVADHEGEERLLVESPVDPCVVDGTRAAISQLRHWWPVERPRMDWEVRPRSVEVRPARAAGCFTGGVDSTALLMVNHAHYPDGHPLRIRTGLVVYGLDESTAGDITAPDDFLVDLAERFGIEIVAARTDLRALDPSTAAWQDRIQVAVLGGAAQAALQDCSSLWIAPSDRAESFAPYGSHPGLDHWFSSTELRIDHAFVGFSRLDRIAMIAEDPELLALLQVCNRPRDEWGTGTLNCGRCEKCIRTITGLRAVGAPTSGAFAVEDVTPADIDELPPGTHDVAWLGYEDALRASGELDLAAAVQRWRERSRRRAMLRTFKRRGKAAVEVLRRR